MVMINKEEYELLKSLEDKWKWIARDKYLKGSPFYGELWIYECEPVRDSHHWSEEKAGSKNIPIDNLFHFIQWEDIEPYSIDYLVLEYESENLPQPPVKEQTEKVEVPQFVFDWIEESKDFSILEEISYLRDSLSSQNMREEHELYFWLKNNFDTFAKAWINYPNIEVEEELLYRARLKVITDEFIASYLRTQSSGAEDRLKALEIGSKYIHEDYRHLSEFTEYELKRLNVWDSDQWEIEGVEEPKYYALIKGHEHIQGEEKYWNYDKENKTLEVGRNRVQDDVLTDYTIQATLSEWEDLGINEDSAEFVKVEGRQLTCQ